MPTAKIDVVIGNLSFSGEGEQEWLAKQLDRILIAVPTLSKLSEARPQNNPDGGKTNQSGSAGDFTATLASHIKAKGGESKQVARFLATADWLRQRGTALLATGAVSKALSDNHQKGLSNAADCLGQNIAKGFCEKKGDGFFITPEGLQSLGYVS